MHLSEIFPDSKKTAGLITIASVLSCLIITVMLSSCDIKNPTDGIQVLFNEDPLTMVSIELVDAKTGDQISASGSDSVRIVIEGIDKNDIIDLTEKPKTSFASMAGFFTFAIEDSRIVSSSAPVDITVKASSKGYIDASAALSILSPKGESHRILLIQPEAAPEGVSTNSDNTGSAKTNTGVVEEIVFVSEVTVTEENQPEKTLEVTMSVKEGTVIRDENGDELLGKLTTAITNFDVNTEESINVIPGGLFTTMTDKEGETKETLFVPAAVISIDIRDENGNEAKSFEKPVELVIELPGSTFNPETNALLADGDIVPVWNYDEDLVEWKYHADSVAEGPNSNGNFTVLFEVNHFSYWSGGWEDAASDGTCDEGVLVHVNGDFAALDIKFRKLSDNTYLSSLAQNINPNDPNVRLAESPRGVPVAVEAWYGRDLVGSVNLPDLCGETVILDVDIPGKEVTFNVEVFDNDETDRRMRPSRGIYVAEEEYKKYVGYMEDGFITVYGLIEGQQYTVWVFHEEKWYSDIFTVDERNNVKLEYGIDPD